MANRILVTGATGYIGGRLFRRLEKSNLRVRCLARRPEHLEGVASPSTEIVAGDLLSPDSLMEALRDVHTAYYLVHSMASGGEFEKKDRSAAGNFARAAARQGVKRIVYLGGLAHGRAGSGDLSAHLRSRHEVGEILRSGSVPVIEFRASIIIGSGSLSFEMVRALVERLPVMVTPRWVDVVAQPISIEDVLDYLVAATDLPEEESRIFEIGGADQVSYRGIMAEYARQRGLRRFMVRVPFLTPRLSSLWLGLVTPLYARIGRSLIESIRNPTVVRDPAALRAFRVRPLGVTKSIARAIANEEKELAETRWSDALSMSAPPKDRAAARFGTRLVDSRVARVAASPAAAFAPIRRIGGKTGWYYAGWLWSLRGALDLLVGGVGMRRGRRDPERIRVGDVVDFWRVEVMEPDRRLRLAAEMKLPGRAWLEFEITEAAGACEIRQTAIYDPVGLSGIAYWYALYPLHKLIFAGMLRNIVLAVSHMGHEPAARSAGGPSPIS